MRVYADSSFLVKLIAREPGTEDAVAEYRRLGRPRLPFGPLHELEVSNAILQKAFIERHVLPSRERRHLSREKIAARGKLLRMIERGAFEPQECDWGKAFARAKTLSATHTERTGARVYDLLHVAVALEFECEVLLTTDDRQAQVARAEGLRVISIKERE